MASYAVDVDEINVILFTNLQLLGLDLVDMEDKYKIPFHKDMFNLPNKAGSQVVLHALFSRLNPVMCKEQFRDCWPVIDKKTELQFRKVCNSWLSVIQRDEVDARMPRMNPALLLSPGGRKFIRLLYSFSTFVLVQVMKEEHGWRAQDSMVVPCVQANSCDMGSVSVLAIRDSCVRERNLFFGQLHLNVAANRKWKESNGELMKDYHGLVKSSKDLELEKRQQVNLATETALKLGCSLPAKRALTMFDTDRDSLSMERNKMVERTRSEWKQLVSFNEKLKDMRNVVQTILDNTVSAHTIDGTALGVHVPGLLLRECNKEIDKREIGSAYLSGHLNLVSVLQLWNMCLALYKQQLEAGDLPKTAHEIPTLREQAHKHHSHLMSTQEMREEMRSKTLPKLAHYIRCLQRKLNTDNPLTTPNRNNSAELGLGLTAHTPHASLLSTSGKAGDTPTTRMVPTAQGNGTPDAVFAVTDNVDRAVEKNSSSRSLHSSGSLELNTFLRRINKENKEKASQSKEARKPPLSKTTSKSVRHVKPTLMTQSKTGQRRNESAGAAVSYSSITKKKEEKPPPSSMADNSSTPRKSGQKRMDSLADAIVDSVLDEDGGKELCSSPDTDLYHLAHSNRSKDQIAAGAQSIRTTSHEKTSSEVQGSENHHQQYQRRQNDAQNTSSTKQDIQEKNVSNNSNNSSFDPVTDSPSETLESSFQMTHLSNISNLEYLGDANVSLSSKTSPVRNNKTRDLEKDWTDDQLLSDIFLSTHNKSVNLIDLEPQREMINNPLNGHLSTAESQNSENPHSSFTTGSPRFHRSLFGNDSNNNMDGHATTLEAMTTNKDMSQNPNLAERVSSLTPNGQNISRDVEGCVKGYTSPHPMVARPPGDGQASTEHKNPAGQNVTKIKKSMENEGGDDDSIIGTGVHLGHVGTGSIQHESSSHSDLFRSVTPSKIEIKKMHSYPSPIAPSDSEIAGIDSTSQSTTLSPYFDPHLNEPLGIENEECLLVDSDRDETGSDEGLNESYVPYRGGIVLESRSPVRQSVHHTPTRHPALSRETAGYGDGTPKTKQSSVASASQDAIQAKLFSLHQRVNNILDDSVEEDGSFSSPFPGQNTDAAAYSRQKPDTSETEDLLSL